MVTLWFNNNAAAAAKKNDVNKIKKHQKCNKMQGQQNTKKPGNKEGIRPHKTVKHTTSHKDLFP